jgi:hypothetical protein
MLSALVALIGQGDQVGGLQFGQDAPDPGRRSGHAPRRAAARTPTRRPGRAGDDLQVHPVPPVLAGMGRGGPRRPGR